MINKFPLPIKENALFDLKQDPCIAKIKESDYERIIDTAWTKGTEVALEMKEVLGDDRNFSKILHERGLKVMEQDKDYIIGKTRYFSEYISGKNEIYLYSKSILIWAMENNLTYEEAKNYILAHEFYHFLEWTKIGMTSKLYTVPLITIGECRIGRTGIRAKSEIAANAFVHTIFEMEDVQ